MVSYQAMQIVVHGQHAVVAPIRKVDALVLSTEALDLGFRNPHIRPCQV